MKKTSYLSILILLVFTFSFSYASDDSDDSFDDSDDRVRSSYSSSLDDSDDSFDDSDNRVRNSRLSSSDDSGDSFDDSDNRVRSSNSGKNDIKEIRNEKKEIISNNFKDLKENRSEIKSEFSLKSVLKGLNSSLTEEIKALDTAFRADVKLVEEEIKDNIGNLEKIKELRSELQQIRITYNEKLISLVTDTEVKNTLTKRLELLKQNFELINSNIDARIEFRGKLNDKVSTYKDKLSTKLERGLPKVKEANIEKVLLKLDGVVSSIENNTKITQVNKDAIIAQLIALKELLEEQIESNISVELEISAE